MRDRAEWINRFLSEQGWAGCDRIPIAGDASARAYLRLQDRDRRAILMDADPARGEDVSPFVTIADHLRAQGLSAPRIFAQDAKHGFLLLEDFGDGVFARLLDRGSVTAQTLYEHATDVLVQLAATRRPPAGLIKYSAAHMAKLTDLAPIWYGANVSGRRAQGIETEFVQVLEQALAPAGTGPRVLTLRDYHAENLMWLPDRAGIARVGLLDFQDAVLAHPAYDLTSVLQDARRDMPPEIEDAMIDRYLSATGADPSEFKSAYAALSLQRNLRILGIFARLSMRDGKPGYLKFVPRVWGHVETSLARLGDEALSRFIREALPAPNSRVLETLGGRI